ncbi:MFS transporter [Patescibacteria group bacterium]
MKRWGVLIILALSMFIIVIDTTIMNVSISALVKDLNTTVGGVQAAISIYALVMASLMLVGGKLGDIVGKKKIFTLGLIFFGIGTSTAAVSQNLVMLIVGWSIIEGIGSALMLPNIQTILRGQYSGGDRALGYGVIGAVSAVGAALGPIIGGYLTTFHTWRYAFLFEVAIVVLVLLLRGLIKKDVLPRIKPKFDLVGAVLTFVGLASIVLAFLLVQEYGLWTAKKAFEVGGLSIAPLGLSVVPFMIGFGIVILMLLFRYESKLEKQNKNPLFKPSMFSNKLFKSGIITDFFRLAITTGLLFTFPLYLQMTFEFTAMQTGVALLPFSAAVLVLSLLGARLASQIKSKRLIQAGFVLTTAGSLWLAFAIDPDTPEKIILATTVIGAGIGLLASQIINLVLSVVPRKETGEAAGIDGTAQQLGNAIGVALIGTILFSTLTAGILKGIDQSEVMPPEIKTEAKMKADEDAQLVSDSALTQEVEKLGLSEEAGEELFGIYTGARIRGFQGAIMLVFFMGIIGLLVTPGLPDKKLVKG